MNSLERSLVEKAGYDNGWERSSYEPNDEVVLASSRHGFSASVRKGDHEGEWIIDFAQGFPLDELKRGFPEAMFRGTDTCPWDFQLLCSILRRAAELGFCVPDTPLSAFIEKVDTAIQVEGITRGTEAERLVRQRVGQNCYRDALMAYWNGTCAVTGADIPELLRASHAKPWAACETDGERLNVYNGFLLSANIDALFDKGLITFDEGGDLLMSPRIGVHRFAQAGLNPGMRLQWIDARHQLFLKWHREHLFMINHGKE